MANELNGMRVALLVTTGFEQEELTGPREALYEAGAEALLVSPKRGSVRAWQHTDWGESFDVDVPLDDASPENYDALVLPGGVLNPDALRMNPNAVDFVRTFFDDGKPVAAICHGPWTLIEAGAVDGLRMTSYRSIRTDLINAGADWVDEEAVLDGNVLTSRNPDDLPAFNRAMVDLFARHVPAVAH